MIALDIDPKFEGKMNCPFKNDMMNLANFHQIIFVSLKIVTLMRSFYLKYKMYELKIYRGVLRHDSEEWCKIQRGIDVSVQNWQEFDKFCPDHSKISKTCTLMGFFWTKYVMFEHWILIQHLNENWLVLSKTTWGI